MPKKYIRVETEDSSIRADKFLAKHLTEYSRAALEKLFSLNLIKIDGMPIKAGERLKNLQNLEYDLGPLKSKPEVVKLPVIYEDENIIVIDKPAGIISHARGRFWQEASVASFIRDRLTDLKGDRGGIVHRLDRATSGVMICAKNESTLKYLQKQFHDRNVVKRYIAIVEGKPKDIKAIIDAPIARDAKNPKKFKVDTAGKSAQTEYTILKFNDKYSEIELKPKTGRTHQLRVHLNYIKHPIIGDELYGGKEYKRLLLHAHKLEINIDDKERKVFESKIPKEFNLDGLLD